MDFEEEKEDVYMITVALYHPTLLGMFAITSRKMFKYVLNAIT